MISFFTEEYATHMKEESKKSPPTKNEPLLQIGLYRLMGSTEYIQNIGEWTPRTIKTTKKKNLNYMKNTVKK